MAKKLLAALSDTTSVPAGMAGQPAADRRGHAQFPKTGGGHGALAAFRSGKLRARTRPRHRRGHRGALLEHGLREDRLVAIEKNSKLAHLLRNRFPSAHIITGDAWHLDELLGGCREPIERVGAVISSLPLLNFPPAEAEALAEKIRAILEQGGKWVQFSYHLGTRRPHGTSHFRRLASNIIWLNLPPARVNVYQK